MNAQMIFDRCISRLLRKYPFWGSLVLGFRVQQSRDIESMSTDGITLRYNPDYLEQEPEDIICSKQAHEAGHKMFLDHLRRKHRDPKLWNVACDYRINLFLRDSGLTIGENWLLDDQFQGMDAEKIYDILQQEPDNPANQQAAAKGGCGCSGLQDHPSKGEGSADKSDSEPRDDGEGYQPSSSDVDFGEAEALMATAQARAFAKARGNLPGSLDDTIQEMLNPKVRWEQIVQRFMEYCCQDDFTWQIPDRRFLYMDMYLPGIESEGVDSFVVAIDTSGSTLPYIPTFLSEVSAIAKVLKFRTLYVMYCDAKVQHVDEYSTSDLPIRLSRTYGGGGTDFRPVFNWLEERTITPKGLVFLTDTEGPFPSVPPSYPVLWTIPTQINKYSIPFGEAVILN